MNDAIALLAISQMVCLGAMGYLYMEVQKLRRNGGRVRREVRQARPTAATRQAARGAYNVNQGQAPFAREAGAIAQKMSDLGVDVTALARRMGKSEEEVRLLLRRQGVVR